MHGWKDGLRKRRREVKKKGWLGGWLEVWQGQVKIDSSLINLVYLAEEKKVITGKGSVRIAVSVP